MEKEKGDQIARLRDVAMERVSEQMKAVAEAEKVVARLDLEWAMLCKPIDEEARREGASRAHIVLPVRDGVARSVRRMLAELDMWELVYESQESRNLFDMEAERFYVDSFGSIKRIYMEKTDVHLYMLGSLLLYHSFAIAEYVAHSLKAEGLLEVAGWRSFSRWFGDDD